MNALSRAHLRVARSTSRLLDVVAFYRDGLGFEVVGSFEEHDGFDGVMLAPAGATWHLELTHEHGAVARRAPDAESLLVLYVPDREEWSACVERIQAHGHRAVASHNPYWDLRGKTFEDPDGYRVVLENASWPRPG